MFLLGGLYRRLHHGQIFFNADAQLQLPAQPPQAGGNGVDAQGRGLAAPSCPSVVIKAPPSIRQGVDLRLEGVMLHSELCHRFNAVFHQVSKLPLVSVKFSDFLTHRKSRPISRAAGGDFPQQI